MNREKFEIAAGIVERMDKLENIIFKLQEISNKKNFEINGYNSHFEKTDSDGGWCTVNLIAGDLATEIFIENILEYYINNLNLELDELRKSLEEL